MEHKFRTLDKGTLYSNEVITGLIAKYEAQGGQVVELVEGSLGYGITALVGEGLKTTIITEVYLNEWSSGHKIRMYNVTPKKYQELLIEKGF